MNAHLIRYSLVTALVGLFSLGGCSKAPVVTEVLVEAPVEKPAPRLTEKTVAELFAEGDVDGDGKLSSDELPTKLLLEWELMDVNADGYIDADEQYAYLNPRGSEVVMEEKKEGDEGKAERGSGKIGQFFAESDTDGDGRISMAEAPGKMQERFATLDGNGDGFIDAEEQAGMVKSVKDREAARRRQGGKGGGKGGGFDPRAFGGKGGGFDPRAFGGFDPGNFGGVRSGGSSKDGSGGGHSGGQPRTIVPPKN